eukprot:794364_1
MASTVTCPDDKHPSQYEVIWSEDQKEVVYDYHRYVISQQQPKALHVNEKQMTCYVQSCRNTIRVRPLLNGKRWIVTLYRMHDTENEQNHQQCHHKLYTPNTRHINNIQQLAYHDRLSGQSKRHTVEEQMLQNPALNRIESVQTMKRKIDRIAGDLCCEYPEAPTSAVSAVNSLKIHAIWQKDFYCHAKQILREKLKDFDMGKGVKFELDMQQIVNDDSLTQDEKLVKGQLQIGEITQKLSTLQEILKLSRMKLNGSQIETYFVIHMRPDGTQIIFGQRNSFKIIKHCSCVGFDQLVRVCPSLGKNKQFWEQAWILHGLFESGDVDTMDENFPAFVILMNDHTEENVRLMGDWSLGEHNALSRSEHTDTGTDDFCGWHMIQSIDKRMKKTNIIAFYYHNNDFRRYVRYFETLRGIHLDCAETAYNLIRTNGWKEIRGEGRNAFRNYCDTYLGPVWTQKYGFSKMNCQGSLVMDNNFCEGYNRKALTDIGMRSTWWPFLWNLKRFLELIAVRYDAFESEGFRRERSAERKDRCKALVSIWNKFDGLDRSQSDVVWAYVNCLYLCWESEYDRLKTMLQCL